VVLILASVESLLRFFYAEAFYVSRRAPGQPHGTEAIGNSYLICFVLFALISVVLIYWRRRRNDDPRSRLLLLATSVFLDILGIGVALSFVFIIQYVQVKLLHH
jgi:hypothetical protein